MVIHHDEIIIIDLENHLENDFLFGLYELSYSLRILLRIGYPVNVDEIKIDIEGKIEQSILKKIICFMEKCLQTRTMIKYNCKLKTMPIVINGKFYNENNKSQKRNDNCILLYSNGLDSIYAKYILSCETKNVECYHVNDDTFIENQFCYFTHLDTFDNDPWENYGSYFTYIIIGLNKCIKVNANSIAIGLNNNDVNDYDIISGEKIYSQCCQSFEAILIYKEICNFFGIQLKVPLLNLKRQDICRGILKNKISLNESVSCIFYDGKIECGKCFSCYSKLLGILAADRLDTFSLIIHNNSYSLMHFEDCVMRFKRDIKTKRTLEQLPLDYIGKILLQRLLDNEPLEYILSSKFSIELLIDVIEGYENNFLLLEEIFPRTLHLYIKYRNVIEEKFVQS